MHQVFVRHRDLLDFHDLFGVFDKERHIVFHRDEIASFGVRKFSEIHFVNQRIIAAYIAVGGQHHLDGLFLSKQIDEVVIRQIQSEQLIFAVQFCVAGIACYKSDVFHFLEFQRGRVDGAEFHLLQRGVSVEGAYAHRLERHGQHYLRYVGVFAAGVFVDFDGLFHYGQRSRLSCGHGFEHVFSVGQNDVQTAVVKICVAVYFTRCDFVAFGVREIVGRDARAVIKSLNSHFFQVAGKNKFGKRLDAGKSAFAYFLQFGCGEGRDGRRGNFLIALKRVIAHFYKVFGIDVAGKRHVRKRRIAYCFRR